LCWISIENRCRSLPLAYVDVIGVIAGYPGVRKTTPMCEPRMATAEQISAERCYRDNGYMICC
jgi:hypothetical protein